MTQYVFVKVLVAQNSNLILITSGLVFHVLRLSIVVKEVSVWVLG